MDENKNKPIASDFLNKLQTALKTGDPNSGFEVIDKINKINVLANKLNPLKNDINVSEPLSNEIFQGDKFVTYNETTKESPISIESEKLRLKNEVETEKINMVKNIDLCKKKIVELSNELENINIEYETMIESLVDDVNIMKIKYEAKFDEKYDQ